MRFSSQTMRASLCFAGALMLQVAGCGSDKSSGAADGGSGNVGGSSAGGSSAGGTSSSSTVPCTPESINEKTHSVGNYDNLSCNKADCHVGKIGGWVYASVKGYPWVAGATVTITNTDGTTLKTTTGNDGFFDFGDEPKVTSSYKVCVSKCPSTDCNATTHTSTDCLSSGCHAKATERIYVTTPSQAGTGGASSGTNCKAPASGGPYVHLESVYSATSNQPCAGCHFAPKPVYVGGFLYDGPTSTKTVDGATIVLTPASGSAVTTVTGPGGMFFFGTNGTTVTPQTIPTPYTACVSKCPTSAVCSETNKHTTSDDCGSCHDGYTTSKVYLK
jgi:hypothetical protein